MRGVAEGSLISTSRTEGKQQPTSFMASRLHHGEGVKKRIEIWKPSGTDIPTINIITTSTRLTGLTSFAMFTTFIRFVVSLVLIVSTVFNRFATFTKYWSAPTYQDVRVSKKNWTRGGIFRMLQHQHCFLPCIDSKLSRLA